MLRSALRHQQGARHVPRLFASSLSGPLRLNRCLRLCASSPGQSFSADVRQESENAKGVEHVGLMGVPGLHGRGDFSKVQEKAVSAVGEASKELQRLSQEMEENPTKETALKILRSLDTISEQLCSATDPAELCRSVHPDRTVAQEANEVGVAMGGVMQELNTNPLLYEAVKHVTGRPEVMAELSEEQQFVTKLLQRDFEVYGVGSDATTLQALSACQGRIYQLTSAFDQNVASCTIEDATMEVSGAEYGEITSWMGQAQAKPSDAKSSLRLSDSLISAAAHYSPEIFRKSFVAKNRRLSENCDVMQQIAEERLRLAKLLGHASYAHLAMNDRQAAPEDMCKFLEDLAEAIRPGAQSELRKLKALGADLSIDADGSVPDWQLQRSSVTHPGGTPGVAIEEYLSLENCIEGLSLVTRNLFGAELRVAPASPTELWHPDVRKLEVYHETEGAMGTIYLDLFSRLGKYANAANFSLQFATKCNGYELPRLSIVSSFSGPSPGSPPLLQFSDAVTLFHEFGHALNNVFSRTEYHHAAGVRSPIDFVEMPSTLMEHFLGDYDIVSQFAKHHKTGETLPKEAFERLLSTTSRTKAIATQTNVALALFDLKLHGEEVEDCGELYHNIKNRICSVKESEDTWWHARFSHVVGYAASYYTYLQCEATSSELWERFFKANPLDRAVGDVYRQEILAKGGSCEPLDMLRAMEEKSPSRSSSITEPISSVPSVEAFARNVTKHSF